MNLRSLRDELSEKLVSQGFIKEDPAQKEKIDSAGTKKYLGLQYVLTTSSGEVPLELSTPTKLRIWVKGQDKGTLDTSIRQASIAVGKHGGADAKDACCKFAFGCSFEGLVSELDNYGIKAGDYEIACKEPGVEFDFIKWLVYLWTGQNETRE